MAGTLLLHLGLDLFKEGVYDCKYHCHLLHQNIHNFNPTKHTEISIHLNIYQYGSSQ